MNIIGALSIDIRNIQAPSKKFPYTKRFMHMPKWQVSLFEYIHIRGWWPFTDRSKSKIETVVSNIFSFKKELINILKFSKLDFDLVF